jgi:hypothetical protein
MLGYIPNWDIYLFGFKEAANGKRKLNITELPTIQARVPASLSARDWIIFLASDVIVAVIKISFFIGRLERFCRYSKLSKCRLLPCSFLKERRIS